MNTVLATEGPLDVDATLSRYRLWGEDPTNCVADGVFRRVLRRDAALVPYEVRWSGTVEDVRLAIRIPGATSAAVSAGGHRGGPEPLRPRLRPSRASTGWPRPTPGWRR